MKVAGSLSVPAPTTATSNKDKELSHEDSREFDDACSYVMIKEEIESDTNSQSNATSDSDNDPATPISALPPARQTVSYGPVNVRVRRTCAPTLATGRRSKFLKLEGAAAERRELRRRRNREAAKKLKQKRLMLEGQLEKEIQELESREQQLLVTIRYLESYKDYLYKQEQYARYFQKKILKKPPSTFKQIEQHRQQSQHENASSHRNSTKVTEEKRSPSSSSSPSHWQLSFSI